ncbi:50S ribosomal protein L13 [Candidatus Micrarchaeota archaeon]|nr:50S ribosomal protein L13 [Candidatus Micrarchaeota archaeon]
MIVFDGTNAIVGRLSAHLVKLLLKGEEAVVVNAEKLVISGDPKKTIEKYAKRRTIQNKASPEESAKWPRRPDLLFKRIVRGMLPKKTRRGKDALKKLRVYLGVPKECEGKAQQFTKTSKNLECDFITVGELCKNLGWKTK